MNLECQKAVEEHADFLPYLHRLILYTIAWNCHKDGTPRTIKGQYLEGREVFIERKVLMTRTGCYDSRQIARACRDLEAVGLNVRKRFTSKTGRTMSAVHGKATIYRCPTAEELEAARPLWNSTHPKRPRVAPQTPKPSGTPEGEPDEVRPQWVAPQTPHRVAPQTPHSVPMSTVSTIHPAPTHSHQAKGSEVSLSSASIRWRDDRYGVVRVGSDGVARPIGRRKRLRWQADGSPALERPDVEGAA